MPEPEYLICMNCESPCYVFEWRGEKVVEAFCEACGNDDPEEFITDGEMEALAE
jgi:translation initiation factor 2 beta subunit (eIF-2beta)/eIF-5